MILFAFSMSIILSWTNPFYMTFMLLVMAASTGFLAGSLVSKWLFASVFLVFLGGMLIVFFYVVSLSKSSKNSLKFPSSLYFMILPFFCSGSFFQSDNFLCHHLYLKNNNITLMALTLFLFICLISITKISESFKGAMSMKL